MQEDHDDDGGQRIPRRLLIAVFEQRGVLKTLQGRAVHLSAGTTDCNSLEEFALIVMLPDVIFGIDLQQVFSGHANKAVAQRRRQILRTQRAAGILVLRAAKVWCRSVNRAC